MVEFNIRRIEGKDMAEYKLQPNDRVDNLTLGMLINNEIEGIAKTDFKQIETDRFIRVDVSGKIKLSEFFGGVVKKDDLLKVFYQIALTIRKSSEYMINWTSFILDVNNIFIDKSKTEVAMVCVPLLAASNDGDTCSFFKQILFTSQFDTEENMDYVGKLLMVLNQKNTYTLDGFISNIEELLEIDHMEFKNTYDDELSDIAEAIEEKEEEAKEESEATEEKEEEAKEESEATEEKEEEAKEELEATEEKEEETKEELEATEEKEEETKEESEATEEKEEEAKEESEVTEEKEETKEESEDKPYLERVSTEEKIYITKDKFVLGKDEELVDYVIDNENISDIHAFIKHEDDEFFIVDNESDNHTYINNVELIPAEDNFIFHGAPIKLADEEFIFKLHD